MALTRKMLKAMGIEEEKIDQIIEAHTETTDALKKERDDLKEEAGKLKDVQRELDDLKANPGDDYKAKYDKEHEDFEKYKAKIEEDKATAEKDALYRQLLADAGIDSKRIDTVMRVTDLSAVNIKDGKIDDAKKVMDTVKTDWKDFIVQSNNKPAFVANPPAGGDPAPKEPDSLAGALRLKYMSTNE